MFAPLSSRWARLVRSRRSVIFCYHGVGPSTFRVDPWFLRVPAESFRAQVEVLLTAGFEFVTVERFAELTAGGDPPPGLVALTFDDGMDDNHTVVMPLLQEYGVAATFFVTTGLIGQPNPWMTADSGARMMTISQLRDIAAAGFEIGAHTVTHRNLSELDFETCFFEANESKLTLERLLGIKVRSFAYPYCHYGPAALSAVRASGFSAAVTCGTGAGSWAPHELPRSIVTRKDGVPSYLLKLAGLHNPIFSAPPGRIARAVTRGYRIRRRERLEARRGVADDLNLGRGSARRPAAPSPGPSRDEADEDTSQ